MSTDPLTTALLRQVRWPAPVQQHLAAGATRTALLVNRHLHPRLVRQLAATADWDELIALTAAQGGDLAALGACRDRALALARRDGLDLQAMLRGQGEPEARGVELDVAVATALAHATDQGTAAAVAAALTGPVGPGTGALALWLDPTGAHGRTVYTEMALAWLLTPAGQRLTDAQAADLLTDRWDRLTEAQEAAPLTDRWDRPASSCTRMLCQVLALRPGLRAMPLPDWATEAQQTLAAADAAVAAAGTPAARGEAIAAAADRAHRWRPNFDRAALYTLVAFALAGDLDRGQRRRVADVVLADQSRTEVGALLPALSAALGAAAVPAWVGGAWHSWEEVQQGFADNDLDGDVPWQYRAWQGPLGPGTPVPALRAGARPEHVPVLADLLRRALAEPDPAVEADRWALALALLPSFTGTLAELAAVTAGLRAEPAP